MSVLKERYAKCMNILLTCFLNYTNEYYAAYGSVEIMIILIFYTMHIPVVLNIQLLNIII